MPNETSKKQQIVSIIKLAISFTLMVIHVYALVVDVWIIELKIPSHDNEIIQQMGVWEICWESGQCRETIDTFYYDLKAVSESTVDWLFHVQMLLTIGTIMLGYGIIVILRRVVNFEGRGLQYFHIFVVTSLLCNLSATVLFALSVSRYFGTRNFGWGISFKMKCAAMCVSFVCFIVPLPSCSSRTVCCCQGDKSDDDFMPLEFENLTTSSLT